MDPLLIALPFLGAFGGTGLCLAGLATGAAIFAWPMLFEPHPFADGEIQAVVDKHNADLRSRLAGPKKAAMVF